MDTRRHEVFLADTGEGKRLHYKLRYEVFCRQTGWEPAEKYPTHEEKDDDDRRAVHFVGLERPSDHWVAAVRLVRREGGPLPVEKRCRIDPARFQKPVAHTAEISRLLIAKPEARRQALTLATARAAPSPRPTHHPHTNRGGARRPFGTMVLPEILAGVFGYCRRQDVPQVAFILTPALGRIVTRLGIELTSIGQPCQHRGVRYPYTADVEQAWWALTRGHELVSPYRLFSERVDRPVAAVTSL